MSSVPDAPQARASSPTKLDLAAEHLNQLSGAARLNALLGCCHAKRWAETVAGSAPYANGDALTRRAEEAWADASEADLLEAFSAHPQIGGDMAALRAKFGGPAHDAQPAAAGEQSMRWSGAEQAGVAQAPSAVLERLSQLNLEYAAKFGFIFIVCATGKSAEQMLALLEARLPNTRPQELKLAAEEQLKITRIRLEKLT